MGTIRANVFAVDKPVCRVVDGFIKGMCAEADGASMLSTRKQRGVTPFSPGLAYLDPAARLLLDVSMSSP